MNCPRCKSDNVAVAARYHFHRVVFGHRVARNRKMTVARRSRLACLACHYEWQTDARVDALPDAEFRLRCCAGWRDDDLAAVIAALDETPKGRIWPDWPVREAVS